MTAAILTLLGTLAGFGVWLWKRHAAKQDNPLEQHRRKYEEIHHGPDRGPDVCLSDELDELDRLQRAKGGKR